MILSLCTCASVYCHSWRIVCGKDVRVDLLPPPPQGSDPTNQRLSGHPLLLLHSSFSLPVPLTCASHFPFSSSPSFSILYSIALCLFSVVADGLSIQGQMVAVNSMSMSLRRWSTLCGNPKGIGLPKLNISCSPPFGCRFWWHFLIRKCYGGFTDRIASSQTKAQPKKQQRKNVTVLHCGCVVSSRLPEDHNSVPPECWWIRKCHQSLQTVLSSERIKKINWVH